MEIEAKFQVRDPATADRLLRVDSVAGLYLGPAEQSELDDTYLDTPDRRLWSAGYVCRLRRDGARRLITVKSLTPSEDGVHRRDELEVELTGAGSTSEGVASVPSSWPEGDVRRLVLEIAPEDDLAPLFDLVQRRTIRMVGPEEAPAAELSVDAVRLDAQGVKDSWRVVEVELRPGGDEKMLGEIAAELQNKFALEPDPRSKFERAVAALGLEQSDVGHSQDHRKGVAERTARAPGTAGAEGVGLLVGAVPVDRHLFDVLQHVIPRGTTGEATGSGRIRRTPRAAPISSAAAGLDAPEEQVALEESAAPSSAEGSRPGAEPETTIPVQTATAQPVSGGPKKKKPKRRSVPADDPAGLYELALGKLPDEPGLDPDDTMAEAARKTFLFHFLRMLRHEEGTRLGEDIEELHDMRVATRRMRAAFRVFGDHLDARRTKPFLKGLRKTGRTLGAVRDLDVFQEKTLHYLDTLPVERQTELGELLAAWRTERERARDVMIRYLDGDAYRSFARRFGTALLDPKEWPEATAADGAVHPERLRDVVPAVVYERVSEVRAFDACLQDPDVSVERYHELRIHGKALRYTLEYFREVLGPDTKSLIGDIKVMQDHLGDLQDAVVSSGVLRTFLAFGTWSWPEKPVDPGWLDVCTVTAVTQYLLNRQEEAELLLRTFPEVWVRIRSLEFSQRVAAAVAVL